MQRSSTVIATISNEADVLFFFVSKEAMIDTIEQNKKTWLSMRCLLYFIMFHLDCDNENNIIYKIVPGQTAETLEFRKIDIYKQLFFRLIRLN